MDNVDEKVVALEIYTKQQGEQLEDHEARLRSLEDLKSTVSTLNEAVINVKDTAEKQGVNIDKLKDCLSVMQQEKAKTEGLVDFFKSIKPKDVIYIIVALALIFNMLTGQKTNSEAIKQITEITKQLEENEPIQLEKGDTIADTTEVPN